jgi:predicted kinase
MRKIIVEKGLPASGKSTCAKARIAKDNKMLRINRDDLRTMGFGNHRWTPTREIWVLSTEDGAIRSALQEGFTPIVDSTNLIRSRLEKLQTLASQLDVKLEICDHTDVSLEELYRRDAERSGSNRVGRVVIERLAAQSGMIKTDKPIVLCDVDGTLADLTHRLRFIKKPEGEAKDWDGFFAWVSADAPIWDNIHFVRELAKTHTIWIVSGRPDFRVEGDVVQRIGDETVAWLQLFGVPFEHIFMRRASDRRDDDIVKKEILTSQILKNVAKEQIKLVVDDRPRVIRMWQGQGLEVKDVGPGVDF